MPEWINLDSDVNGITVNQYFVQHPEMILGEMKEVSGPYGMETTCAPMEGADLELQLQEAVKMCIRDRDTGYRLSERNHSTTGICSKCNGNKCKTGSK